MPWRRGSSGHLCRVLVCGVPTITIGPGVMSTPDQKARLEKAAARLPEGAKVSIAGHDSGSAFTVTVTGIAKPFVQPFAIGSVEKAIALLEKLAVELSG